MLPKGRDREHRKRGLQTKSNLRSFVADRMQILRAPSKIQKQEKNSLRVGPEPAEFGQSQVQCMLLSFNKGLKQVGLQLSSPVLCCGTVSHMNLRILPTEQLAQTPALSKAFLLRDFIL